MNVINGKFFIKSEKNEFLTEIKKLSEATKKKTVA